MRPLDAYEIATLSAALSGGNRKKTQDLIDMRRKEKRKTLKGGQVTMKSGPYPTSPTSPTASSYASGVENGQLVDYFEGCEASHYNPSAYGAAGDQIQNTNTNVDTAALRNCVGPKILGPSYSQGANIIFPSPLGAQLADGSYATGGPCSTGPNNRANPCPASLIDVPPSGGKRTSRKNKSRSLSRNMARKSSRRSTRRASTRKVSRKGSRKTRRANRK